jgi:hypothetical protein
MDLRISPRVWVGFGALAGIALLISVGIFALDKWQEWRASQLFAEAHQLVQQGQEAEKSSYAEAFEHYQVALKKAQKITENYPSTSVGVKLTQEDATLGPYTITELQDSVVPKMKEKAEMEGDPLAVALLVANKVNDQHISREGALTKAV